MKTLIFCPGLTGPFGSTHQKGYSELVRHARERGWNPVLVSYPGQMSSAGTIQSSLSPQSALRTLRETVTQLSPDQPVRLCGFSFGCHVVSQFLLEAPSNRIFEARLWAPIPYWTNWEPFACGKKSEGLGRGTTFAGLVDFFSELAPMELLLQRIKSPIRIAMGAQDEYSPPEWIDYLSALAAENAAISTMAPIEGGTHTITQSSDFPKYLDFLLN